MNRKVLLNFKSGTVITREIPPSEEGASDRFPQIVLSGKNARERMAFYYIGTKMRGTIGEYVECSTAAIIG